MTKPSNNTVDMYTAQNSQRLANQLAMDVRASRESKVPEHMWVSRNGRVWSNHISSAAIAGLDECMIPCGPDGVRRFEGWLEEKHGPGNWWIGEWKKGRGGQREFSSNCPTCDNPSVKGRHKPYCRKYVLGLTTTSKSLYSDASTGSGKKKTLRKKGELSRYFSKKVDELEDQIRVHIEKREFWASSEVQKKLALALWIMVAEDLERVPLSVEESELKDVSTEVVSESKTKEKKWGFKKKCDWIRSMKHLWWYEDDDLNDFNNIELLAIAMKECVEYAKSPQKQADQMIEAIESIWFVGAATRIQAAYRGKLGRAVARRWALSKKISRIRKEIFESGCEINDDDVVSDACECLGIDMSKITETEQRVSTIYRVMMW